MSAVRSNKSLIIALFCTINLYSCGLKKSNDMNTSETQVPIISETQVPISPALGVSASVPTDILYVATAQQKSLMQHKGRLSSSSTAMLFQAKGDGGLGADLNEVDLLNSYEGIPVVIQKTDISENEANSLEISVEASGDNTCAKLISYDVVNSKIIFNDTSKINKLTICNVKVSASGVVKEKIVQDQNSFTVSLNPTLAAYAKDNDPVYLFLAAKMPAQDINGIAHWLKEENQSVNLKIDPLYISSKIENINALTGAQNITSLDVSKTDLKDLRALLYFKNLRKLDISETRIDPKDLGMLGQLKNLKTLYVRHLDVKDLTFITKNIPNLVELDISENSKIQDLSEIKNLKKLDVLKASNIGMTHLNQLSDIKQVKNLDLSYNNLSELDDDDIKILSQLDELAYLNVSFTNITDSFLNNYFGNIHSLNTLKSFIDRNYYNKDVNGGCENINDIDKINNLNLMSNLTFLDLHGNGCNITTESWKGLTSIEKIHSLSKLEYLDISDTPFHDLSELKQNDFPYLKTLILVDDKGNGISSTAEACLRFYGASGLGADCNKLPNSKAQSRTFGPGATTWVVPRDVYTVTIRGCSAANSGAGAGGGGGGATIFTGNWFMSSWGGDGAASGNVNGQSNAVGGTAGTVGTSCNTGTHECARDHQAASGSGGGDGEVGARTIFGSQVFSLANPYAPRDPNISCLGGSNGSAGAGGRGVNPSGWSGGNGGNGGTNAIVPWSSKIETYTLNVHPDDVISINVGAAGAGGYGGAAGSGQDSGEHGLGRGQDGASGSSGSSGTNGILRVEWSQ